MSEAEEIKQESSKTKFYDPFDDRSNKSSFDHQVFGDPWSSKPTPPLPEKTKPSEEGDPNHGK